MVSCCNSLDLPVVSREVSRKPTTTLRKRTALVRNVCRAVLRPPPRYILNADHVLENRRKGPTVLRRFIDVDIEVVVWFRRFFVNPFSTIAKIIGTQTS